MQIKIKQIIFLAIAGLLVVACASIGSPDGGPYDETPPLFLGSTPEPFALNVKDKRVVLEFDEFIKIEKAAEKVVISPPQLTQPEIKTSGKKIVVALDDSLKSNTTYSIDFSDAIVDYNEGNPLGNFAFLFSTGSQIDTLAVSGTVLDASNLEPIKGILVGLHSDLSDSAFITKPFDRVSRTDADGRFTICGIAPGRYRAYALQDVNQNFKFDQKNEMIAFLDSLVVPYTEIRMHQDTTWIDSLTIDTIRTVPRVHYCPMTWYSLPSLKPLRNAIWSRPSARSSTASPYSSRMVPIVCPCSLRSISLQRMPMWCSPASTTIASLIG